MSTRTLALGLAVALQVVILVAVPGRHALVRMTGQTVSLKLAPVDPYDLLSGYYMALAYEIGDRRSFPGPPSFARDQVVFAVVEEGADGTWRPVALLGERPEDLPPNRLALRGRLERNRIRYGIEAFYVPEVGRQEMERELRDNLEAVRAEVRVGSSGRAALVRLRLGERTFE